jgi:hypothetical protein
MNTIRLDSSQAVAIAGQGWKWRTKNAAQRPPTTFVTAAGLLNNQI